MTYPPLSLTPPFHLRGSIAITETKQQCRYLRNLATDAEAKDNRQTK